ncbi:unnamed protein product, partial [Brassica rapa subsp. trilocularis]
MVRTQLVVSVVLVSTLLLLNTEAKTVDPYKVLGVSRVGLGNRVTIRVRVGSNRVSVLRVYKNQS